MSKGLFHAYRQPFNRSLTKKSRAVEASVVYEILRAKISHLILGKIYQIGYVDLMDFHINWPKDSRGNDELITLAWRQLEQHVCIIFAILTLNSDISITNQNIEKACHSFVD